MAKKYLITTAQYNAGVNKNLLKNMDRYAASNDAEILILPTAGKNITEEEIMTSELNDYRIIDSEYKISKSLKIKDFGTRPQQINPLTGLDRFAQGDKSYILPGTKQMLRYVANSYDDCPKTVMTTGAITHPNYNLKHRVGRIANSDHTYGFVVVEKVSDKYFHFRHVKSLKNGNFSDITGNYKGGVHTLTPDVKAMVMGDIHPLDINPIHKRVSLEQLAKFKPTHVFLHDTFNGKSISHHYLNHNIRKHEVYNEQGLNLEDELKTTLAELTDYAKATTNGKVYVVASNHDEHLYRYLDEGRFIGDKGNDLMGSMLYTAALQGYNPLEFGLAMVGDIPHNVEFIERDTGFKLLGFELGNHGDLGANGGRGSPRSIENANSKSITGHGHSPFIIRDTYRVGTSTNMRLDYNKGYSSWANTNAVLYNNGTVQLLNTINKKYRG